MKNLLCLSLLYALILPTSAQLVMVEKNLTTIGTITVNQATDTAMAGMIRWTGKDLEGFDGRFWLSLTHNNVRDIDLNIYKTVRIGGQEWFVQNLMTTRYNDGFPIPRKNFNWGNTSTPAFTWVFNDSVGFSKPYGALYNWYVTDPASNGNKNPCPVNWGVPTKNDFDELKNYLQLKGGSLKDTLFWQQPNLGATNLSGFSAVPAGLIDPGGSFEEFGSSNFLWSTTVENSAYSLQLNNSNTNINISDIQNKKSGLTIRCIRRNYTKP